MQHHCLTCKTETKHRHLHDTAHGISGTHMAGSERFQCRVCERTTFAHSGGAEAFPFCLDGQAQRTIAA